MKYQIKYYNIIKVGGGSSKSFNWEKLVNSESNAEC